MKKSKTFDCVRMKDDIQEELLSQWQGLSDAEVVQKIRSGLDTSDSPLAAWWRHLNMTQPTAPRPSAVAH